MTYVPGPESRQDPAAAPDVQCLTATTGLAAYDYQCQGHPGRACWQDRHRHWALIVADGGGFVYHTARGAHLIEPGLAILARPDEAYRCDHPFGADDRALVVTLPAPPPAAAVPASGVFLPTIGALARLTAAARARGRDGRALGPAVAAMLTAAVPVPAHEPDGDLVHGGHAVVTALTAPGDASPSVATIGADLGLSRFAVHRLVQRVTGLSPHQYRIRHRLASAARLLTTTDRSVTAIAADVGWEDLSTFQHAFRRHVGCSPGLFRQGA